MTRRMWRLLNRAARLENTGCACPAESTCPRAELRALAAALGVAYPLRHRPAGCQERAW